MEQSIEEEELFRVSGSYEHRAHDLDKPKRSILRKISCAGEALAHLRDRSQPTRSNVPGIVQQLYDLRLPPLLEFSSAGGYLHIQRRPLSPPAHIHPVVDEVSWSAEDSAGIHV